MKMIKNKIKLLFALSTVFYLNSSAQFEENKYSDLKNWAAHPFKLNLSDSVPNDIKNEYRKIAGMDVFFVHPTTYTEKNFTAWNASITDIKINQKTDQTAMLYQASVFNEAERLYAPRYQQAHIQAFYIKEEISKEYFDLAYDDIKAAFMYYLKNYNNGRPFIIASHSQGTLHAGRLIKEIIENTPLEKKLICAYLIGMPVPENYFKHLMPCIDSLKTNCFVSWRTYKKGYYPKEIQNERFKSVVINPLNWKKEIVYAKQSENLGAIMKQFNKLVPAVVDANIERNILWSCKPDVFGKWFFFKKNFHIGDINLFYKNIRMNVRTRAYQFFNEDIHVDNHHSN
jgi:hypothetical protein